MKALRFFAITFLLAFLALYGMSRYLAPDDLRYCGDTPATEDSNAKCQKVDAIVAVSGGDTDARTDGAIKLFKNGWADYIVFSGAAADKSGPSNAQVMAERAEAAGIDRLKIIVEGNSETTEENAAETKGMFESHGIRSIIVVTSAYHERRATLEFQKRATGVTVKSHPVYNDKDWSQWWWTTPFGWYLAITEFFKSLYLQWGGR